GNCRQSKNFWRRSLLQLQRRHRNRPRVPPKKLLRNLKFRSIRWNWKSFRLRSRLTRLLQPQRPSKIFLRNWPLLRLLLLNRKTSLSQCLSTNLPRLRRLPRRPLRHLPRRPLRHLRPKYRCSRNLNSNWLRTTNLSLLLSRLCLHSIKGRLSIRYPQKVPRCLRTSSWRIWRTSSTKWVLTSSRPRLPGLERQFRPRLRLRHLPCSRRNRHRHLLLLRLP